MYYCIVNANNVAMLHWTFCRTVCVSTSTVPVRPNISKYEMQNECYNLKLQHVWHDHLMPFSLVPKSKVHVWHWPDNAYFIRFMARGADLDRENAGFFSGARSTDGSSSRGFMKQHGESLSLLCSSFFKQFFGFSHEPCLSFIGFLLLIISQ